MKLIVFFVTLCTLFVRSPALADADSNRRQFAVTLHAMGSENLATPATLQNAVEALITSGSSEDDAFTSVMEVAKEPRVNPGFSARLTMLARDIAAARGNNMIFWTTRLVCILSSNVNALIDFIYSVGGGNAMPAATAEKMREMGRHGESDKAMLIGVEAMEKRFGGSFKMLTGR